MWAYVVPIIVSILILGVVGLQDTSAQTTENSGLVATFGSTIEAHFDVRHRAAAGCQIITHETASFEGPVPIPPGSSVPGISFFPAIITFSTEQLDCTSIFSVHVTCDAFDPIAGTATGRIRTGGNIDLAVLRDGVIGIENAYKVPCMVGNSRILSTVNPVIPNVNGGFIEVPFEEGSNAITRIVVGGFSDFRKTITAVVISGDKRSPEESIQGASGDINDIINNGTGTPLADKLQDALDKLQTALDELNKESPDNQAALGNIEGAIGDLEAAVNDELLDAETGNDLMDQLAGIARQLAEDAIAQAVDNSGDPDKIEEAETSRDDGDALRASGDYKDAVNKYKDALAKAESALS